MSNFDSTITNRKFSAQQLKEFDVPDESQSPSVIYNYEDIEAKNRKFEQVPAELEAQIRAAKDARRLGKERLNEGAKRRIEMLVGMIKVTRSVDLEGNIYVFKSLTSKETRDAIAASAEFDGNVQAPFEIRRQFLARSLTHISGVEIEDFIGSNSMEAKMLFLDELDHTLLNRLYEEYLLLNNEVINKYSIKTVEEAKEVMEDLKK